jgi:hypothetical protein
MSEALTELAHCSVPYSRFIAGESRLVLFPVQQVSGYDPLCLHIFADALDQFVNGWLLSHFPWALWTGRDTEKVDPFPSSLSTVMVPP